MREYQPAEGKQGNGYCISAALETAGFADLNLPEWVRGEDLPSICGELGLQLHTGQNENDTKGITLRQGQPVIAIYKTNNGGHVQYTRDVREIIAKDDQIVGIVELPEKEN